MTIEYDISCFERKLIIEFSDHYENLREEIMEYLDDFYNEWHTGEGLSVEDYMLIHDSCLEEYMMDRLSEIYNMWDEWSSIYYGNDEEE